MKKTFYVILYLCFFVIKAYPINRPYYHFKQLSIKEGLPTSIVSLYDDKNGSLWVGTTQGVYRFNGEKIKKYHLPYRLRQSSHYINDLFGDNESRIWAITSQGISYYEYQTDSLQAFLRHNKPVKASIVMPEGNKLLIPLTDTLLIYNKDLQLSKAIPFNIKGNHVIKMQPFDSQRYLIINSKWEMKLLNTYTGEITPPPFDEASNVFDLYQDTSHRYWISFYGQGVKCYSHEGKLLTTYNTRNSGLNNDIVLDITEWNKAIWLATDGGGVNIIYPDTRDVQILSNKENRQFPANSVTCLCHSNNHIWIGMVREGVLGAEKGFITTYTKAAQNPASGLSDKCPLCLWEDKDGCIWMGTDGGGINCFDPQTERFTHYKETLGEKIVSICPLSDTELLASSFSKGIFRFHKKTGSYRRFSLPDKDAEIKLASSSAPTNLRVNDKKEIELYGNAFYRYIPASHQLIPILPGIKQLQSSWVYMGNYRTYPFFHDRSNVFRYNKEKKEYETIVYEENNQILAASIDTTGTLWIAGPNGVSRIHLPSKRKESLKLPDGNDVITSLVIDREGTVWMGSLGIIYAYDPYKNHFVIYNEMDGILPNDFLAKPVLAASDGNIYMGGSEGLVRINKALKPASIPPPITLELQEVSLNGNKVPFRSRSTMEIPYNFSSLQVHAQLEGENVFHKRIYRFRIKGLNTEYTETSRPHLILHTISPGDYRITVQCTQNDGNWSPEFTLLKFTVLPPWWHQTWFVLLCAVLIVLVVIYAVRGYDQRLKRKYKEQERTIYKDKVKALININHELRTPLTLIYTPLKQLTNSKQIPYELRGKLHGAFKQARQMKNIIDMILNMRKMEVEKNILRMSPAPFNEWLQSILDDFKDEFSLRNIQLTFVPDAAIHTMYFDHSQCEIIINNLLTNAYKFSEENSTVTVSTCLERNGSRIRVSVKDEGIGLQKEDIANLFTRFYQGKHSLQGSGIGLSYAKQLVEMHGGIISAQNNEQKGATFFFILPYRQEAADIQSTPQTYLNNALQLSTDPNREQQQQDDTEKFHSILIVEDDRDLCNYLICNLQVLFEEVYEAHDGMEALPILTSRRPQIVLSDVKMPRMNGFELCRYIKQKPDLNYMPVILLTSCVDDASMEEGYKMGAEVYITKPFDMDLLCIQIQNIMHHHNIVKKHYAAIEIPMQKGENLSYINEQLMIQFNRIIHENIGNVDMDVNFIAQQMGMSRASLYNKTKGVMDMGISEYIIKCRLEYACKLLDTTALAIGEVAEQAGFRHSRNFSTTFKNIMGMSPSDYRKRERTSVPEV